MTGIPVTPRVVHNHLSAGWCTVPRNPSTVLSERSPMTDNDDRTVRPFADFLRDQNKGKTHEELSTALNDLVSAVTLHEKGGTLTLKIEVKPMEKGNTDVLIVTDEITVKSPKPKRKPSVFFPDAEGNLRRENPAQMTLPTLAAVDDEREQDARERAAGDQ